MKLASRRKKGCVVTYFAPTTLDDALKLLRDQPLDVVAGCTDYFPTRTQAPFTRGILDVSKIAGLQGISALDDGIRIGAATRWSDIARTTLPGSWAGLQAAARQVGSLQIQNAGTVGGNICNASPAADGMPPLLTLNATVEIQGPNGVRHLPLAEFVTGVRQTDLQPGELVVALHIPNLPTHSHGAFEKLGSRRYLVISVTMVAVVIACDAAGRIEFARVAVGACSPVAQRLHDLEVNLIGQTAQEACITPDDLQGLSPISDLRASAEFRLDAVAEQIRRALLKASLTNG